MPRDFLNFAEQDSYVRASIRLASSSNNGNIRWSSYHDPLSAAIIITHRDGRQCQRESFTSAFSLNHSFYQHLKFQTWLCYCRVHARKLVFFGLEARDTLRHWPLLDTVRYPSSWALIPTFSYTNQLMMILFVISVTRSWRNLHAFAWKDTRFVKHAALHGRHEQDPTIIMLRVRTVAQP